MVLPPGRVARRMDHCPVVGASTTALEEVTDEGYCPVGNVRKSSAFPASWLPVLLKVRVMVPV